MLSQEKIDLIKQLYDSGMSKTDISKNSKPLINTSNIALPYEYAKPKEPAIIPPIIALNPIPGASTSGELAIKDISKLAIKDPIAVAINTDENLGSEVPLKIVFGLTIKIYDIAKKVVIPAIISMLTFVFLSFNLNNFSISVKK